MKKYLIALLICWAINDRHYVKSFCPNHLKRSQGRHGSLHTQRTFLFSSSLSLFNTNKNPPFLAIITETNACDTDERVVETFETIKKALGEKNENGVDLISIRVVMNPHKENGTSSKEDTLQFQHRLIGLAKRIMALKDEILTKYPPEINQNEFFVVINDNEHAAMESNVDGIHVKESKTNEISSIRRNLIDNKINRGVTHPKVVVGTSAHSIESATSSWISDKPDYYFVGTCYMTQSHPEKSVNDLEGPKLPGRIKDALANTEFNDGDVSFLSPIIFAIGGIDELNCREPVLYGADGVAAIRGVMQASDPLEIVKSMKQNMQIYSIED